MWTGSFNVSPAGPRAQGGSRTASYSLIVRFRVAVPFERNASDSALLGFVALRDSHTGPLLRYGIAKGMLDGTVDAASAAMLAPYERVGGTGLPRWEQQALNDAAAPATGARAWSTSKCPTRRTSRVSRSLA